MSVWTTLLAVALFALACNLDTVLLAVGYAAKGVRVSFRHSLVIAGVTTLVTWLSLVLGGAAGCMLPAGLTEVLGALALVGMGFWVLLDCLRRLGEAQGGDPPPAAASAWGWVSLAAALAVNNAGVGAAAGVTGISPLWAALGNFSVTLAALALGCRLGRRASGRLPGRLAPPLSGALLILLGLWRLLG